MYLNNLKGNSDEDISIPVQKERHHTKYVRKEQLLRHAVIETSLEHESGVILLETISKH
jgi:hypothetical protein